jgi:hypothetical protein
MSSNRLELYYATYAKVMLGLVLPAFSGAIGILILSLTVDVYRMLTAPPLALFFPCAAYGAYFLLLSVCLLLRVPSVFAKEPRIIIDEKGITDNTNRKAFTIPWSEIREISFPYCRELARREHFLSIKFRNPQEFRSRIPFLRKLEKRRVAYPGDYEISFYYFKKRAPDVYSYFVELRKKGQIPSDLQVGE